MDTSPSAKPMERSSCASCCHDLWNTLHSAGSVGPRRDDPDAGGWVINAYDLRAMAVSAGWPDPHAVRINSAAVSTPTLRNRPAHVGYYTELASLAIRIPSYVYRPGVCWRNRHRLV
ncbi:hypothetical protein ARTHRO8AJ_210152 [Arthrobacter sp. 8AJ]|nr:hypothetical protein ARTHRO8AJ_210152 [Arthrobacter sp. 8AJ]